MISKKCIICEKEYEGYGNNPYPLAEKGQCCDECNIEKVIPARLRRIQVERVTEEFFRKRFPEKNINFERQCGYFGEWIKRFESRHPEIFMDNLSMKVWKKMLEGDNQK